MTLKTITDNSATFTDETFTTDQLLTIANKGISRINTECNTLFPFFESLSQDYKAFPEMWMMDLISPYVSYGIKMNDSSLSEADRYLDEFYRALNRFKEKLGSLVNKYEEGDIINGVSPEFIESEGFGGVYGIDTSSAINIGFFSNDGNGGSY